jgi:mycothiol synthase
MNRRIIRRFTDADYEALVAVHNACYPDHPESVASWRHSDATREARIKWGRWLCEEDGRAIGVAGFSGMSWMYHPRKFYGYVMVLPAARRRGVGAALYERLLAELAAHEPLSLRGEIFEEHADGLRFAAQRGFAAGMRERESVLDLTAFDPDRFAADVERALAPGDIAILGYEELADDPDRHRKLWELEMLAGRDMPAPQPLTAPDREAHAKRLFEHPQFFPECFLVALDEGAYVGQTWLWHCETPGRLHTGFTGVLREYRGRGIATALKVKALARAKGLGYRDVLTWNDTTNASMLGVNDRLGFRERPAWIDHELVFAGARPETPAEAAAAAAAVIRDDVGAAPEA